jgi:hypothetical protein
VLSAVVRIEYVRFRALSGNDRRRDTTVMSDAMSQVSEADWRQEQPPSVKMKALVVKLRRGQVLTSSYDAAHSVMLEGKMLIYKVAFSAAAAAGRECAQLQT